MTCLTAVDSAPPGLNRPCCCALLFAAAPQRNATGYFNVLNEEGRVVVGALLALDPQVPLPEVMPEIKDPLWERGFTMNNPR